MKRKRFDDYELEIQQRLAAWFGLLLIILFIVAFSWVWVETIKVISPKFFQIKTSNE